MNPPTLLSCLASQRGLSEEAAQRLLFRRGVGPWKWPLVWLVRQRRPEIFRADGEVLRFVGQARNRAQFEDAIETIHSRLISEQPFWRGTLGLRVSSSRLRSLAYDVFRNAPAAPE
ncbi:MAG TPA: hypothetical protein VMB21_21985 [Candidatus Limnocylindria bacterium]|jgi:hypothetical protein|nr:hypothetical protein [Candidatus Limnocylindria bacterium]